MEDTYLANLEPATSDLVRGYTFRLPEPGIETSSWNASVAWSTGGLVSTALDLGVFMRALSSGELFSADTTLDEMLQFSSAGKYGLGVEKVGDHAWGHRGSIFGFTSSLAYVPETDTVVVVLVNSDEATPSEIQRIKDTAVEVALP